MSDADKEFTEQDAIDVLEYWNSLTEEEQKQRLARIEDEPQIGYLPKYPNVKGA